MPFDVKLVYADGSKARFRQTPGIWQDAPQTAIVRINSAKPLKSLTLEGGIFVDFVDFNPSDNIWESS